MKRITTLTTILIGLIIVIMTPTLIQGQSRKHFPKAQISETLRRKILALEGKSAAQEMKEEPLFDLETPAVRRRSSFRRHQDPTTAVRSREEEESLDPSDSSADREETRPAARKQARHDLPAPKPA